MLKYRSLQASWCSAQVLLPGSQLVRTKTEINTHTHTQKGYCKTDAIQVYTAALISHPSVTESVGTAFRVLSGGGRLTLTYRTVLTMHIFMPDVAFSQIHGKFINLYTHFSLYSYIIDTIRAKKSIVCITQCTLWGCWRIYDLPLLFTVT